MCDSFWMEPSNSVLAKPEPKTPIKPPPPPPQRTPTTELKQPRPSFSRPEKDYWHVDVPTPPRRQSFTAKKPPTPMTPVQPPAPQPRPIRAPPITPKNTGAQLGLLQSISNSFKGAFSTSGSQKDENNTQALRNMRKSLKQRRSQIGRKSFGGSSAFGSVAASERAISNFEIEDFFDQELEEEDQDMNELLKEVQTITLSNIVQRERKHQNREEFGTPVPPSVSHDGTPISEGAFSILRTPSLDNQPFQRPCVRRNFNRYVKKAIEKYIKENEVVNYPNNSTVFFNYQEPVQFEQNDTYKIKPKLFDVILTSSVNPEVSNLKKQNLSLKKENSVLLKEISLLKSQLEQIEQQQLEMSVSQRTEIENQSFDLTLEKMEMQDLKYENFQLSQKNTEIEVKMESLEQEVQQLRGYEKETKEYALKNKQLTQKILDMNLKFSFEKKDLQSALEEMSSKYIQESQKLQDSLNENDNLKNKALKMLEKQLIDTYDSKITDLRKQHEKLTKDLKTQNDLKIARIEQNYQEMIENLKSSNQEQVELTESRLHLTMSQNKAKIEREYQEIIDCKEFENQQLKVKIGQTLGQIENLKKEYGKEVENLQTDVYETKSKHKLESQKYSQDLEQLKTTHKIQLNLKEKLTQDLSNKIKEMMNIPKNEFGQQTTILSKKQIEWILNAEFNDIETQTKVLMEQIATQTQVDLQEKGCQAYTRQNEKEIQTFNPEFVERFTNTVISSSEISSQTEIFLSSVVTQTLSLTQNIETQTVQQMDSKSSQYEQNSYSICSQTESSNTTSSKTQTPIPPEHRNISSQTHTDRFSKSTSADLKPLSHNIMIQAIAFTDHQLTQTLCCSRASFTQTLSKLSVDSTSQTYLEDDPVFLAEYAFIQNEAQVKLAALDEKFDDIQLIKECCYQKLNKVKFIDLQQENDKDFVQRQRNVMAKTRVTEKELNQIDDQITTLKMKREETCKILKEMKSKKFEQETLWVSFEMQISLAIDYCDKLVNIEAVFDQNLEELRQLAKFGQDKQEMAIKIQNVRQEVERNIMKLQTMIDTSSSQMDLMMNTLGEMKNDSQEPKADYYTLRDQILIHISDIKNAQNNRDDQLKSLTELKSDFEDFHATEYREMIEVIKLLNESQMQVLEFIDEAQDLQDEVQRIKGEMGDCQIPQKIKMRKNELLQYLERVTLIQNQFEDLKTSDQDIEEKIQEAFTQGQNIGSHLQNTLELYTTRDFTNYNNINILIELKMFKNKIQQKMRALEVIHSDLATLKLNLSELFTLQNKQEMLEEVQNLKNRLLQTKCEIFKIGQVGVEMDCNTTHDNEDEFIHELQEQVPTILRKISGCFTQIDQMNILIQESQASEIFQDRISEATKNVEACELMAQRLEAQINDWNAVQKLLTRYEELNDVEKQIRENQAFIQEEHQFLDREFPKVERLMIQTFLNSISDYRSELFNLSKMVLNLNQTHYSVFSDFDLDVPSCVKKSLPHTMETDSLLPNYIYYMISINCKYKKPIGDLQLETRVINENRRQLQTKYSQLKREITEIKIKVYKPVKGDHIDELFAQNMNKAQLNFPIKRISVGKYLFGSKTISAKIINGKLVIRVGGGYLSFEEFVRQYAPNEIVKINANESVNQSFSAQKKRMSLEDFKKLKIDISAQMTPRQSVLSKMDSNDYDENQWEKMQGISSDAQSDFDEINFANLMSSHQDDENELRLPSICMLEDQVINAHSLSKSKSLIDQSDPKNQIVTPKAKIAPSYYPSPTNSSRQKLHFINKLKQANTPTGANRGSFTFTSKKLSTGPTNKLYDQISESAEDFNSQI